VEPPHERAMILYQFVIRKPLAIDENITEGFGVSEMPQYVLVI
jgi:hypothetical protein